MLYRVRAVDPTQQLSQAVIKVKQCRGRQLNALYAYLHMRKNLKMHVIQLMLRHITRLSQVSLVTILIMQAATLRNMHQSLGTTLLLN